MEGSSSPRAEVAGEVHRRRLDLGLSQHELARVLGVHVNTISNWERGYTQPGPVALVKLRLFAAHAARDDDFAATLAAAATPHPIEQAVTQLRSLIALIVQLEAAKDHPYPRLRATLARLADEVAALGKQSAGRQIMLAEAAAAADDAVAAALARLNDAEGMSSIRPAAGYTQKELAALLHVTERTWRRWESELVRPGAAAVRQARLIATRLAADAEAASPGVSGALARLDAAVVTAVADALASLASAPTGRVGHSPTDRLPAWMAAVQRVWTWCRQRLG